MQEKEGSFELSMSEKLAGLRCKHQKILEFTEGFDSNKIGDITLEEWCLEWLQDILLIT